MLESQCKEGYDRSHHTSLRSPPMPRGQIVVSRILCGILAGIVGIAAQSVWAKSALQMLQESPKPRFRDGHTLLPLTRWGWTMPLDVRVELAEHWGYALEFGSATTTVVAKQLDDPKSIASQICALTTSNPKKYPLCVLATRPLVGQEVPGIASRRGLVS